MNTTDKISTCSGAVTSPEFFALPRPGMVCPVCGLGRSYLYKLLRDGQIRSVSLRERGKTRGKRLLVADSVLGYLRSRIEPRLPGNRACESAGQTGGTNE